MVERTPTRLCVYCGSNTGTSPAFAAAATRLGTSLANRGIGLVFGGGSVGLMGLVADAVLAAGGHATGVITQQLVGAEVAHRALTELEIVPTMHDRKARLCDLADGFVVLPGGFGTVDEFAEMLTWNQLGIVAKPVVLLDVDGYWAPLLEWMDRSVEAGFVRPSHRMLAQRAVTVDEAIALATAPVPDTPHKWLDRDAIPRSLPRVETVAAMPSIDLAAVERAGEALFAADAPHGLSLALVVMQSGEVVHERYGHQPDTLFGPGGAVTAETTLISWSMAKSITHAAVGILVGEGLLQLDAPAAVAQWRGTAKGAITLQQLLNMRSGLEFVEDYEDDSVSNCLEMLYGSGKDDMAAYAAGLPLIHEPGEVWNYSSGTTNIISRIVGNTVQGGAAGMEAFLRERLFGPAGMHSAIPKFDPAGTFVGSSYVYGTARDFARFGELYRNDGLVDGRRVLPAGWAAHAGTSTAHDPDTGYDYGAHWWMWPDFVGSLACHGYEGQYTVVLPDRELVVVHLGKTPSAQGEIVEERLRGILHAAA